MAATPPSDDENSQNSAPAPAPARATNEDRGDAKAEVEKQTSPPSVFVNSEPMREDQVQNAVKFLQHPRVKGSPVVYRRSFLERKGLTKEEIDEAFRRVPDPPPTAQTANVSQDGQVNLVQPQPSTQSLQPVAGVPPPGGAVSSVGTITRSRFHWYHAILAVGILAVSGAGTVVVIKNAIIPRLKSWVRKVVLEEDDGVEKKINSKPSVAEEAAAAAKAAAAAASDVAKASQEMLYSKNEDKKKFEDCVNLLDAQLGQMKLMLNAIQKLEATTYGRAATFDQEDYRIATMSSKAYANGKLDTNMQTVTPSLTAAPVESSVAPHPKSYMEIMAMVQRGEKPSNIRDIDDLPPNPNQQPSNPRLAPKAKPWEVGTQNNSGFYSQTQEDGEGLNSLTPNNGVTYQINGNASVPWWQKRNVNITENDSNELKVGSSSGLTAEKSVQRTWVPPQPPPVALPEAAEAIRRPKPSIQKEQFTDEQLVTNPNVTDELQKATKISESGGTTNYENLGESSSEIQVEENGSGGQ
ncbi:peroxisomal membrane protein PEX14 isoform X2 [Momordica charantia]|uniref:Peroxisomal membrane protein PEX14 n=1 Tax=Momordica charantia TaxID=3673 RepID=A0A6J1C054_MOMCH|nr:peroxisomal membrane protein PEX14 isoform X2 [Momordica charantia]